jgi:hypothetical protein
MDRGSETVIRSIMKMRSAVLTASLLTLGLVACGDPDTNDARGYTKAPLETPGWTVEGEEPSAMAELGDPIDVPSMDTLSAETGAPAQNTTVAPTNPQPGAQIAPAQTPAAGTPAAQ